MRQRLVPNSAETLPCKKPSGDLVGRAQVALQSLRFRLSLGVSVALGLILVVFLILHHEQQRRRVIHEAEANLTQVGQIIEGSLVHSMLSRDLTELQQILDELGRQRNIRAIWLLSTQGEVRFASGGAGVGTRLDQQDPGCQPCHQTSQPASSSIAFTTDRGEPMLRNCTPIANRPSCYACHDSQQRLTGALVTDFSLAETNARLSADLRLSLIAGATVVVVGAFTVVWLLNRLLLGKLDQVILAIRRFGREDRSHRVPVTGADEIGCLAAAFNDMADGLQAKEEETARLYHELQQKEAARAQLLHEVIRVQEEERKRIARELHDDLAQTLTALTLGLETALHALPQAMSNLRKQLAQVRDLTETALGQTHRWIQDLRPLLLDDLGLVPAIRWYTETRLEGSGTRSHLEVVGPATRLPAELESTLFRTVQEAVNNVAKHARARNVRIRLRFAEASIIAEIEDDGVGFDPREFLIAHDSMRGIGLLGMRERVTLVGGQLTVTSRRGLGTRIRIEVPWKP